MSKYNDNHVDTSCKTWHQAALETSEISNGSRQQTEFDHHGCKAKTKESGILMCYCIALQSDQAISEGEGYKPRQVPANKAQSLQLLS